MKWFKPKYSVCSECGVHFEPVTGYESRWGNLCSIHRKSVKERDEKKDAVLYWASVNWERLAKIMEEERTKQQSDYRSSVQFQNMLNQQAQQNNAKMNGPYWIGNFFG